MFFYNDKNFCLRGVQEQYNLRFSQIVCQYNPDQYTYSEYGSKNRNGRIEDHRFDTKCVIIKIFHSFQTKAHIPALVPKLEYVPWFARQCIGQHKLQKMVKTMFKDAKIDGNLTNHSLRYSTLGFQKQLISRRELAGHKSSDALRLYERVNEDQLQAVSNILGSTSSTKSMYNEALKESFSKKKLKRELK